MMRLRERECLMSDLHALMVIFIGLAATIAVWLGTMGLSFLFH